MATEIKCTKCENHMSFGAASRSMHAQITPKQMVENMALMVGWTKVAGKWVCKNHV